MKHLPLVSVIVPTRNSSFFLEACLTSIRDQSYPSIELIVVDNHSNDHTLEIAKRFTQKSYTLGPERSAQRNYGASMSKGLYVVFIDSDMVLSTTVIEECVIAIHEDFSRTGIIIPEESFGEGFWAQCKKLERSFYVGVEWMEAARFVKKEAFIAVGGYSADMISGEDWDLSNKIQNLGSLGRISSYIFHNEGTISLLDTIRKKFYYAKNFSSYMDKNAKSTDTMRQTGITSRYKLFLSDLPKLLDDPRLGLCMLFMKTLEFGVGAGGYAYGRLVIQLESRKFT